MKDHSSPAADHLQRRSQPPKILVADDEPRLLEAMTRYLSRRHWTIATARDGEEALRKIAEDRPDLVIADIGMPRMDGFQLFTRLRRESSTRTIPFIFLTGRGQATEKLKASRIGADDYLTKPCSLDHLAQSVEAALDRIAQARKLPLEKVGLGGRIEDVDLLDLIQALELEQRTGALVLSHGERTGTLYFREGTIVEAAVRSPVREEPLFRLLGWKTGRFLFIPDLLPEQIVITGSMANVLFQDLLTLEQQERELPEQEEAPGAPGAVERTDNALLAQVFTRLDALADKHPPFRSASGTCVLRILIVGVARSGTGDLIELLLTDLSQNRWAALENSEQQSRHGADLGRVRVSPRTALHLIAVRAEKRFRSLWERCVPGAIGAILLVDPMLDDELRSHYQVFLKAKNSLSPELPVHVFLVEPDPPLSADCRSALLTGLGAWPGLTELDVTSGRLQNVATRLGVMIRLLDRGLHTPKRPHVW
jgi:DNA-binding response OmpR family regulator